MTSRSEITARIFALAKEYEKLIYDAPPKHVEFEDYNRILEYEAKLNAYGSLLSTTAIEEFLLSELNDAENYLDSLRGATATNGSEKEATK